MFELSQLSSPSEATNELIHRVIDQAGRNGTGFISVVELTAILYNLGILMSSKEIEILSTGFASNGKGGNLFNDTELVDCKTTVFTVSSLF